jgi:hypothetical protein
MPIIGYLVYTVNTYLLVYTGCMGKAKGKVVLYMNIDAPLLERIKDFRFEQRFDSQSEAIEYLLDYALKQKPKRDEPKP